MKRHGTTDDRGKAYFADLLLASGGFANARSVYLQPHPTDCRLQATSSAKKQKKTVVLTA
jgi:hypothetical protein